MLLWALFPLLRCAHLRVGETDGQAAPFPWFHFMVFGDENFKDAVSRIGAQAEGTGLFPKENIHVYRKIPEAIWNQPQWAWHRKEDRGHGYWFWKSAMIRSLFDTTIPEGGVLLYADAGCEFGRSDTAGQLWRQLLEKMKTRDLLVFGLTHPERRFTKGDIFSAFNAQVTDERYGATSIIAATYFLIKNTAPARAFLEEWERLCGQRKLVSDEPSKVANFKKFIHNRHDQSLFSMLVKSNEPIVERCQQEIPPFPQTGIRDKVHGIANFHVELLPDIGYPPSPCNPISATRSGDKGPRLSASCNMTQCRTAGVKCLLGLEEVNLIHMAKSPQ